MVSVKPDEVSKEAIGRLETETQKAATRNKRVVLGAFCLYALLVGGSVALLPSAFTESALVASRKAAVPHWCGFAGFLSIFCVELVSLVISTDAAKTRVMVVTLGCSLMGALTYLLLATEIAPVMLGPASGFPVYPSKMLTWICSTSLMIYVVWNAGETPVSHLFKTLGYNTVMLIAGLIGFAAPAPYVPFAFTVGMVAFCGMGYGQWTMIGMETGDNIEMHRANMAMLKVKCIMVACWFLFPAVYGLQFFNLIPHVALESMMVFADILAKSILMSSIQQGHMCTSADRKQALMQRMALDLVEDLKEADKRKDRFLATMTHELRTPLNGIVGITESLLISFKGKLDARVEKGIQTVRDSGKRFSQLVATILDSASVSESKLRLTLRPVSMAKIVDEVALLIEPLLRNSTKLSVNVPPSLPEVDADYDRLLQVMFNLIGNACKFTDEGEISVKVTSQYEMLRIEVKDTGIGISANKHSTIFQPFEQGDNSRTRAHGGTGLGLSLARSLVEAHEGTLTVRSELRKGSTFCVLLPLKSKTKSAKTDVIGGPKKSMDAVCQAETVDQVASAPMRLTKSGSGRMNRNDPGQVERSLPSKSTSIRKTLSRSSIFRTGFDSIVDGRPDGGHSGILFDWLEARKEEAVSCLIRTEMQDSSRQQEIMVVDDETANHAVITELLSNTGLSITSAMSGHEALGILEKRHAQGGTAAFPDIILMDLMMPGISGQQTMENIRSSYPDSHMPIIMLSANEDEPAIVAALEKGCQDYIVKPFKPAELLARVGLQMYSLKSGMRALEVSHLEQLLEELLPVDIVRRLKEGQQLIADKLDNATIVSVGVAGLTEGSTRQNVKETVAMVDELFSMLDTLADQHGFSKVEALGGGSMYTLLAGHEQESSVDHACRAVRAAVGIIEAARQVKSPKGDHVEIRIGIHTGPVVAGIIGCKGPRYCIMGGALEVSSMLESTSPASCVQVSDSTYAQVQSTSAAEEVEFIEMTKKIDVGNEGSFGVYLLNAGDWQAALDAQEQSDESSVDRGQPYDANGAADAAGVEGTGMKINTLVKVPSVRFDDRVYHAEQLPHAEQPPRPKSPKSPKSSGGGLFGCFASPLADED